MKIRDITGEVFGRLTVINFSRSKIVGKIKPVKKRFYLCKCICGKEIEVGRDNLINLGTQSCGCLAKELVLKRNKEKRLPDNASLWNLGYKYHLRDAKVRNIDSFISPTQHKEITSQNCYYCDDPPSKKTHRNLHGEIFRNGIDRIDSTKPYIIDNIRPCCGTCNYMKLQMSEDEFFKHIQKINKRLKALNYGN